eukprot:TRINITY_DN3421_c2_g1_i1.p1 TRINITY_DN3421_c2_g1~~TRINITY_DN3421_c2_g1_i1.p1  ORF type:complete len:509 (-),score=152.88 TRINITY_DN3421_c2_g1_i1:185-1711(-)
MDLSHVLSYANLSRLVKDTEYAVRGRIVEEAQKIVKAGKAKDPFEMIFCNIGNPQSLGQLPITFFRSVLSMCMIPTPLREKLKSLGEEATGLPADVFKRAEKYHEIMAHGFGAYSDSRGFAGIREEVAAFIDERDKMEKLIADNPSVQLNRTTMDDVFLTDGASPGIQKVLQLVIADPSVGVMLPIPQYPLYSATVTLLGGKIVPYYMAEDVEVEGEKRWSLREEELEKEYEKAVSEGTKVRALVVINPGNPTGQCLTEKDMRLIVDFCQKKRMVLLADEVYQTNIYRKGAKFVSFRRIVEEMTIEDYPRFSNFELFSFHSVSKGMLGECGLRGGYCHVRGIAPEVIDELYKLMSIGLCSNTVGQVCMGLMVNPPKPGDDSYELYLKEYDDQFNSLARRAKTLSAALNKMEGITCNDIEGAMYAFPRVSIPEWRQQEAKDLGMSPDLHYCLFILRNAHIVIVNGSGFRQEEGTFHFRTTILPSEKDIDRVIERLGNANREYMTTHKQL